MSSRFPVDDVNCLLSKSAHKWMSYLFILGNGFQSLQALLELLFGWWILTQVADKLNDVESCLFTGILQKSNYFV